MDILKLINELEGLIENRGVFMGVTTGFHPDDFLDLTNKIRAALPEEVKRATRVTAESDSIVDGARITAEQTIEEASAEAERITKEARSTGERLMREAEGQAAKITQNADLTTKQIVAHAQQKAEEMLREAKEKSDRLLSESEVVKLASAQAREVLTSAENEAREMVTLTEYEARDMKQGADEYAQGTMADLERQLAELLTVVQRGRTKLDQRVMSYRSASHGSNGRARQAPPAPETQPTRR